MTLEKEPADKTSTVPECIAAASDEEGRPRLTTEAMARATTMTTEPRIL